MTTHPSQPDPSVPGEVDRTERPGSTIDRVLPVLGEDACLLHPREGYRGDPGGGDFDCAVRGLDPQWPLRVEGLRVCQCIRHGPTGWYWVVEHDGAPTAVDALDDPLGVGPLCFPTGLAFAHGADPFPAVKAAFVTLKRLRKGIRDEDRWLPFMTMARSDPGTYRRCMEVCLGKRLGSEVAESVLSGRIPETDTWKRVAIAMRLRRIRSPERALSLLARSLTRLAERMLHPTGLFAVVAGPDGVGKSTLSSELVRSCGPYFWGTRHLHWRPGLLPQAGALVGSKTSPNPDHPHDAQPHGRIVSVVVLLYYWMDFFLGSWLKLMPLRVRSTLIVLERGWWDIAVDPRRYRMQVPAGLVSALGSLLPRPDITLLLEAPGSVLLSRKQEITLSEAERQTRDWRRIAGTHLPHAVVNASLDSDRVLAHASEVIVSSMERRTANRTGLGWVALPERGITRWIIPRGPRTAAKNGLSIYQPVSYKGRAAWEAARVAATAGLFRFLPRGAAPHPTVRRALAPHIPPRGSIAVMRPNHPGRSVALILDEDGTAHCIAKVAADGAGRAALQREFEALTTLGPLLPAPLRAPSILHHDEGILLLEAVPWRPRAQPWLLPSEAAGALGGFFAAGRSEGRGPAHGDFAPWNLLETERGWVAVDWESGRSDAPPFYDLFHYLVQSCTLLGHPSREAIIHGVVHDHGPVAELIRVYEERAGIDGSRVATEFLEYLDLSGQQIDPATPGARGALRVRDELRRRIERTS